MSLNDIIRAATEPLTNMIRAGVRRGVISIVNDAKKMQEVQAALADGENTDYIEHFQPYGFTSYPVAPNSLGKAEAIVISLGGTDLKVALIIDDRRYRPKSGEAGESGLYHYTGHVIRLLINKILFKTVSSKPFEFEGGAVNMKNGIQAAGNAGMTTAGYPAAVPIGTSGATIAVKDGIVTSLT